MLILAVVVVILVFSVSDSGVHGASLSSDWAKNVDPKDVEKCHPIPNDTVQQYIIGYGSLINSESKGSTSNSTGANIPVNVTGISRHWNAQPKMPSFAFATTFLGILRNPNSYINAVIYPLKGENMTEAINAYDKREIIYCRVEVKREDITILPKEDQLETPVEEDAQFWIYENKLEFTNSATDSYPIVQSYVDIFISGCIEQEQKFGLNGYAEMCVKSTQGWSTNWVNDRIYPRRPSKFQPLAYRIDSLLKSLVPHEFSHIKIE